MNEVPDIVLFIGRFHPLVVHLPVGILLFAALLEGVSWYTKDEKYRSLVPFSLLMGTIGGIVACIMGYMLSLSGDYDGDALDLHLWFGIATVVISFIAYLFSIGKLSGEGLKGKPYLASLVVVTIVLSMTGHFGGNLTHGSDYLTAYAPFQDKEEENVVAVTDVNEANYFQHIIQPILDEKCVACHRSSKKKGQLSYENAEAILKGGKNGPVFIPGDPSKSEMLRRVHLPHDHKEFMPPEGKTPLTEEEIAIITHWIESGGDTNVKFGAVESSEEIKETAAGILGLDAASKSKVALASVSAVAEKDLNAVVNAGFKVRELVAESNLYDVILPSGMVKDANSDEISKKLELLKPLKGNILWLSLGNNNIKDSNLQAISGFNNLQLLKLEKNPITDAGIDNLKELNNMTSLNLFGTEITKESLPKFSNFPKLKKVYVWNTKISKEEVADFKEKEATNDLVVNL